MDEWRFTKDATAGPRLGVNSGLPDALAYYLRWHQVEGHTPATVHSYQERLGLFARFLEDKGHSGVLSEITPVDVLEHLEQLKLQGAAPATIRSRCLNIKTFYAWALEFGLVTDNPMARLRLPKVPRRRKEFLTPQAFDALLDICPLNTFLGAGRQSTFFLFATTGMRLKDLASLQVDDLIWDRNLVRIRLGKGQKERWAPFLPEAKKPVFRYMAQRNDSHPCLWVTEERRPMAYNALSNDVKRMMNYAGINVKDRCHVFRRTFAANAVKQAIPRPYIQAVAGWTTSRMLDHYTQAMMEEEAAAEAFKDFSPFVRTGDRRGKP